MLYHADVAARNGLSQAQFLVDFSFARWSQCAALVSTATTQIKVKSTMIQHLAGEGYAGLIRDVPHRNVSIDERSFESFRDAPLHMALCNQDLLTTRALLDIPEFETPGNVSNGELQG
jgi:hypothetical protein